MHLENIHKKFQNIKYNIFMLKYNFKFWARFPGNSGELFFQDFVSSCNIYNSHLWDLIFFLMCVDIDFI